MMCLYPSPSLGTVWDLRKQFLLPSSLYACVWFTYVFVRVCAPVCAHVCIGGTCEDQIFVCVCVGLFTYLCLWGGDRYMSRENIDIDIFLDSSPPYFLRHWSDPSFVQLHWLASKHQGSTHLCLFCVGMTEYFCGWVLPGVWGPDACMWQVLYSLCWLPKPIYWPFLTHILLFRDDTLLLQ